MQAVDAPVVGGDAVPMTFDTPAGQCFGWFHPPRSPMRDVGVVLCRPAGYEGTCAYETYTQLAEKLSHSGYAVVRFDYHGTGDSAGSDQDPARVQAWLESISAAMQVLKDRAGVSRLALFGVRLGATLAVHAASAVGGVDGLILWAPCVTGRAFVRELRASAAGQKLNREGLGPDDLEALGYIYTADTLQAVGELDCQRLDQAPAKRALIIGRDDLPIEGPLPKAFQKMGMDVLYEVLPGYSKMIVEPTEGVVAQDTLAFILDWLNRYSQSLPSGIALPRIQGESLVPTFNGVREVPIVFGQHGGLFGILTEPADVNAHADRPDTAILMLNVGTNHRVGPNRLYVKMARSWAARGYRAFRFDLAGIGDSRTAAGYAVNRLYSKESIVDVQAAIDCLVARGCKHFIVMGLCSGAYVAFQTALTDSRVTGQILMNPRRLEWKPGETLQSAMQVSYKSTHFYRRELLNFKVYLRLLRGEIDVKGIVGRQCVLMRARLGRVAARLLGQPLSESDVLGNARQLSAKGTDTLMIIGEEDDGRDYIEFHLGHKASRLRGAPNFRLVFVGGSDHTFSNAKSQEFVIETVQQHLDTLVCKSS